MNTYQQFQILINTIQEDSGDEALKRQKLALINRLIEAANKYLAIIAQQGYQLQVNNGTTDPDILSALAVIDQTRSRTHDRLIAQISAVNRLCVAYELEPIYQGSNDRREKGDFALQLIKDYFSERV